jgi:hypothetical protein
MNVVPLRGASAECRFARSGMTQQDLQIKANGASREAWRSGKILLVSLDHPALDWADRQMVLHLAKRLGLSL